MKTMLMLMLVAVSGAAQNRLERNGLVNLTPQRDAAKEARAKALAAHTHELELAERNRVVAQLVADRRLIDGATNTPLGRGWKQFTGRVVSQEDGLLKITGQYNTPLTNDFYRGTFFVAHVPGAVADGDSVSGFAKETGVERDADKPLRKLDHGQQIKEVRP